MLGGIGSGELVSAGVVGMDLFREADAELTGEVIEAGRELPSPPEKLSAEARELWERFVSEYDFREVGQLTILASTLEAFDRMRLAQAIVDAEGILIEDRFKQKKRNPAIDIERDMKQVLLRGLKQLNIDLEPLGEVGRPPGRAQQMPLWDNK